MSESEENTDEGAAIIDYPDGTQVITWPDGPTVKRSPEGRLSIENEGSIVNARKPKKKTKNLLERVRERVSNPDMYDLMNWGVLVLLGASIAREAQSILEGITRGT